LCQATPGPSRPNGPRYNSPRYNTNKLVQVIAGYPTPVRRVARPDLVAVPLADPHDLSVDLALEPWRPALAVELVGRDLAENDARAVGEKGRQLDDVLDGEAVGDGVRAARVIAEHAPQRRAVGRRGVRTKEKAQRAYVVVQVVLDETRLHPSPQLVAVHLEHAVHVPREVEHQRVVHRLARERRAAAARQDRDPEPGGDLERGLDVVGVARDDDAHGFDLVHGGVGRVEEARSWIEADVSADSLAELT